MSKIEGEFLVVVEPESIYLRQEATGRGEDEI